ncbi:MAG: 2-oxoacid:acceptor oxidoreductase subunit alpha [Deltaproteobacteria bacterium]|jgi:2-oxoglutarate ferredoxin oxidoreductase subunit alpha|nr:2-oxoacid:acceptor oxidoreductase subunit alpha [Deltaproteobacteria bacterium]
MQDVNVVIAGAAGEGIQTIGAIVSRTVLAQGYAVFTWQEYESRIRGGQNSYSIRISDKPHNAPLTKADILLALNPEAVEKYRPLIGKSGILISGESSQAPSIQIPFAQVAKEELGKKMYANTVAVGALIGALGIDLATLQKEIESRFGQKGDEILEKNRLAAEKGYQLADEGCKSMCPWNLPQRDGRFYHINGNEAIALGAAYAGCRFISAYPMTPSTEIITYLAENENLGVFAEQAEDEIAAIGMAIGAGYAGTRAMTATAGGGFALMVEHVSLAGMIEVPVVIVVGQRPGPATGLPTRTSQGDLLFVIHAGHGEFPKLVLAASDPLDAFYKTVRAFNLADKYQIPVLLLTDQFLADSGFSYEAFDIDGIKPETFMADPDAIENYRRYQLTDSGISPRLYPGQSKHLVGVDSDEHDERGHITEELADVALQMAQKRLAKLKKLKKEVMPPQEISLDEADTVLMGWGSTREAMMEALDLLKQDGIKAGVIHFSEMWPLPGYVFPANKKYWTVESNATGQLARLLRSEYAVRFEGCIQRLDGLPMTANFIRTNFDAKRK